MERAKAGAPTSPLDILDRKAAIDQIMSLLEILSEARSSCTFGLEGKWGSGKTFILNMIEERFKEPRAAGRFLVFRYNCWEYDYYEEPLVAIVSAMRDSLDWAVDPKTRGVMDRILSLTKGLLKSVVIAYLNNLIGLNLSKLEGINLKDALDEVPDDPGDYDTYFVFRKVLDEVKEELAQLAGEKTLVIIVDELDRCLPDYAVKILERLHHLFFGLDNTVVIMALDETQLNNTVSQIFGDKMDTDAYLQKFIDFKLRIDIGKVNSSFLEKFADYTALFNSAATPWDAIDSYLIALFSGIDVRTQEHIIKRAKTIHELLFSGKEQKDYSFMCFELLLTVLKYSGFQMEEAPFFFIETLPGSYRLSVNQQLPLSLKTYVERNWTYATGTKSSVNGNTPYVSAFDVPLLLIGYSEELYERHGILRNHEEYIKYRSYISDFKEVNRLLDIIQ